MSDPYTDQAKVLAALSAENGMLRAEVERLTAKIKKYEDEQCASCRAYRQIEKRAALEDKP